MFDLIYQIINEFKRTPFADFYIKVGKLRCYRYVRKWTNNTYVLHRKGGHKNGYRIINDGKTVEIRIKKLADGDERGNVNCPIPLVEFKSMTTEEIEKIIDSYVTENKEKDVELKRKTEMEKLNTYSEICEKMKEITRWD